MGLVSSNLPHSEACPAVVERLTQRHLDAVELAAVADAFRLVPVATWFEIAAVVDTSYVVVALVYAGAAIAAADAGIAVASAYVGADCAFGDASAIRREVDYPVRRERFPDDRQQPLEVCNWHRRWGWTDVRWELACVPYDHHHHPYQGSGTSTCNQPCRPYFRVLADADNRPRSACRSDCTGETSDKACPADLP